MKGEGQGKERVANREVEGEGREGCEGAGRERKRGGKDRGGRARLGYLSRDP